MFEAELINPTSADEYAPIIVVHNAVYPDSLDSEAERFDEDSRWPDSHLLQRFVIHYGGTVVAEGAIMEPFWAHVPGKYFVGCSVASAFLDEKQSEEMVHDFAHLFARGYLADREVVALTSSAREDKENHVAWLLAHGYRQTMRYPVSELDVRSFDSGRFEGARERVAASGIEIIQLSELQKRDADWMRKAYEMCSEIEVDIPSPDPVTPQPFEQFAKGFSSPNFLADGWFVAVDCSEVGEGQVGAYVAVSMLGASQANPDRLYTWLTGVRRSYRRRGLALVMKLDAIDFALSRGTKYIRTDNEENNPMFQINLTLGFEPKPAWLDFEKHVGE